MKNKHEPVGAREFPFLRSPQTHKEEKMYTETIALTNDIALDLEGLTLRAFQGEEDLPKMLEVFLSAMEIDGIDTADTLEDIKRNYAHLVRCDPTTDMIMAEMNGALIAYGRCWWDEEFNGDLVYTFFVNMRPEWRGKGIGIGMARHLMDRLRVISLEHPADTHKYFQVWANDSQRWQIGMLERLGLKPVRYNLFMTRPCSQPVEVTPLPPGIGVRPVKATEYRKVRQADQEAFRDHWGYVESTEEDYQSWLEWPGFDPSLWQVAWQGEEIVGQVLNFINHAENEKYGRKRGYTEEISVRRPWRQQGVARALLTRSIAMFQQMGMEETALNVDIDNPNGAKHLYESVGYREAKRFMTYRKAFELE